MGRSENLRKLLLQEGIEPNPRNSDKYPLHESAEHQHVEAIKILLADERVDVNATDGVFPSFILFHFP
jgi:hypothetical protein